METLGKNGPFQLPVGALIEVRVRAKNKQGTYGDWSDTNLKGVKVRARDTFLKARPVTAPVRQRQDERNIENDN
jgi:hypothetical protein